MLRGEGTGERGRSSMGPECAPRITLLWRGREKDKKEAFFGNWKGRIDPLPLAISLQRRKVNSLHLRNIKCKQRIR